MKIKNFNSQYDAFMHLAKRYERGKVEEQLFYLVTQCVNEQGSLPLLGMDDGHIEYAYPDDNTLKPYRGQFVSIKNILH